MSKRNKRRRSLKHAAEVAAGMHRAGKPVPRIWPSEAKPRGLLGTLKADLPGTNFKAGERITEDNVREIGTAIGRLPEMREVIDRASDADKVAALEALASKYSGSLGLGKRLVEGFTNDWWSDPVTKEEAQKLAAVTESSAEEWEGATALGVIPPGGGPPPPKILLDVPVRDASKKQVQDAERLGATIRRVPPDEVERLKSAGVQMNRMMTEEELWKKSPALAIARDLGAFDVKHAPTPEKIRQVAVQFYLRLLAASLGGHMKMQVAANTPGAEWPANIVMRDVVESAVKVVSANMKASGPLTDKETRGVRTMLGQYLSTKFFGYLREARIFQFRERDYGRLYHLADLHVTTACGYRWQPAESERKIPEVELKRTSEYTVNEGVKVPFPAKIPFKSCYFAWGAGVEVPVANRLLYGLLDVGSDGHLIDTGAPHRIMATLVTDNGWVFSICLRVTHEKYQAEFIVEPELEQGYRFADPVVVLERIGEDQPREVDHSEHMHESGDPRTDAIGKALLPHEHSHFFDAGWTLPYALTPWLVNSAVEVIDSNDSLLKALPHTLKERLDTKSLSKRTNQKFLPAPYYVVMIQPTTYEEKEHEIISRPKEWSHQWDVRGHYGHKIMRGTLPLDPKLIWQLHKRGYELFHAMHRPTGEVLAFLVRRRVIPPQEGEWLAYLKFRREAYVKGPKDKPYVPSVHRLRHGVPEVV